MKVRLKRVLALLLAAAMLASFCSVTVFAGEVAKGTNGKTIYLNWTYYSDKKVTNKVDSLEADTEYYARLGFSGNPIDQGALASICSFSLYGSFDTEKIEAESILSGDVTIQKNIIGNEFNLQWASPDGIINEDEELLAQGCLARICFKTKRAVSSEELHGLFKVNAKLSSGEETNIGDGVIGNPRLFTIVECPAFVARLADNAPDFFPTTTAEKIAENLVGEYIDENGNATAVSNFTVTLPATGLVEGKNVVTASYNGYTCDVTITVKPDTMTGISITHEPNMSYNSGDKLNLTGLVVSAQYASGNTVELGSGVYATDPAKNTELTVAEHNGKRITVTVGSFTAETTGVLTVSPANISGASIEDVGPFEYTGEQIKPEPAVSLNGKELVKDTDYTLSYDNNTNVTTEAKVIVTAAGTEYTGSAEKNFEIKKATGKLTLKVNNEENAVTITYGDSITFTDGNGIAIGTDITIHYQMGETTDAVYDTATTQLNVGTYTFWAVRSGDANHDEATSNKVVVIIKQRNIASLDITVADQTYSGAAVKPDVTVRHGNIVLNEIDDYTLSGYDGNVNVTDNASVNVTGTGNYNGEATLTFKINPKNLGDISNSFTSIANLPDKGYTGEQIKPEVTEKTITIDSDTLEVRRDYEIIYGENTNAGTATVTVKPVDGSNYTFTQFTHEFQITKVKIQIVGADFIVAPLYEEEFDGTTTGGDPVPYFTYDGNEHGVKFVFNSTKVYNGKTLDQLINVAYVEKTYIGPVEQEWKYKAKDVATYNARVEFTPVDTENYEIYGANFKNLTWKIMPATITVNPADVPSLNVLCSELVNDEKRDYDYDLSWLGAVPSTVEIPSYEKFSYEALDTSALPKLTFKNVTALAAGETGKVTLLVKFRNYEDVTLTVDVNYINKKTVELTVADVEAVYGETYAPVVLLDGKDVTTDCTITYSPSAPKNVGEYTITVSYSDSVAEGEYPGHVGTATAKLTITPKGLTANVSHDPIIYGDAAPTTGYSVEFEGLVNNDEIAEDAYTVDTEYTKGCKVDNYKFTCVLDTDKIKNYTIGNVTGELVVNPKSIAAPSVTINDPTDKTYTGSPCVQGVSVKDSEAKLTVDDISVTYENNINVGTATIIYTGKNNYTGEIRKNFKITEASITDDMIANIPSVTYNTRAHTPEVTVAISGRTLEADKDYTVSYASNINAGTATVTVTGKGNFTGTASKTFTINKAGLTLNPCTISELCTETDLKTRTLPSDFFLAGETETGFSIKLTAVEGGDDIFAVAPAVVEGENKITFRLKNEVGAATFTVTVTPVSGNYNGGSYALTISTHDRTDVSGSISFPDGSAVYTGTGIKYENATISGHSGTLRYGYTPNASTGASLDASGLPLTVGTYTVAVTFNSDASFGYKTATFTITKATPTGTPGYTKLETSGKTLADAKLTVGTIRPAGTIAWDLPLTTVLEDGKAYAWTFTPADTHNYTILTGTLVPYVDDGMDYIPGVIGGNTGSFNFHDVSRFDYFYDAVKWAAENGIASGTGRYTFSPNAVCTRAQTVTFLWRAAGSPLPRYRVCPFTDVQPSDYYYNAVLWAVEQGITTGLNATTFGPDVTVTRGQVATFLYRAASAAKPNTFSPFTDVKTTAYNYNAILWAYDNRITTGTSDTTFSPDAYCTRAQIVTFLYRYYQGR